MSSPQSSTARTITRTERKHWSLDQLQMTELRFPTAFPPLSSHSPTATTAGELEYNSNHVGSGNGLDSSHSAADGGGIGKAQFRYSSSGSPSSGKVLVTRTGPKGNSNSSSIASRDTLHHARRNRNSHHGGQSQQGRSNSMGDCHSTLQHSHQQNFQFEPLLSSVRTDSSTWVLPPIPTFEELGLRFDRSRTTSTNAIGEDERLKMESQQQQQQMQDQRDIHRSVTNALLQAKCSSNNVFALKESGCHRSGERAASGDDNVLVMPDMIPDNHPSIFDDILSDDNEAYIIWSTPSISAKPPPALSAPTAGPSSGGVSSVVALPESAKNPAGSDASSLVAITQQQHQQLSSSLDNGATSAGQDRSLKKRWSTNEPLNVRIKEANRSTDTLHSFGQSNPAKQDGSNTLTTTAATTGNNLQPPKTPTTAIPITTTATEVQQKNRVIMAATVEKLVEKLTSEIDYTFLTDFFLIYRLFISPMALLKLIIVRFHWALVDDSPQRQIVRIRTFVTLRHWLLNYFEFDFMRSKDLRQTLGLYLRSLTKHPRVTNSMREQRIVKELRQYVQSLKTIHYRKFAQQKLEKQSRKQQQQEQVERRRRLQARRSSAGRRASGNAHSGTPQGQSSSNRSSVVLGTTTANRQSVGSDELTEVLAVEFRSSDQSDDDYDDVDEGDYSDEDEDYYDEDGDLYDDQEDDYEHDLYSGSGDLTEDDGFEPSSENSLYDSEYDSEYSDSVEGEGYHAKDGEQDQQQSTVETVSGGGKKEAEVESLAVLSAQEEDLQSECHLPSPAFSPRSGEAHSQGGSGSFSPHLGPSAGSSAASRTRARGTRPGLPDFQAGFNANSNSKVNHSPLHQSSSGVGAGAGSRRGSRAKPHSRPLSTFQPLLSPPLSAPPLSPRGSLRSVEPYMNPPPRSVVSIEKKKVWSRYMSATVGRLSKMKRVFTSNSHKNDGRYEDGGGSGTRRNTGAFGRTRSNRRWQGNLSDPEGEKVSYLLACPGMNILLSHSDDRHGPFGRGGSGNKRGGRLSKEDGRSGWSSEGDYSPHDLTRQRNQEILSDVDNQEEEPNEDNGSRNMSKSSPFHDQHQRHYHHRHSHHHSVTYEQASAATTEHAAQFENDVQEIESFDMDSEVDGKSVCSECEREQYFSSPAALQRPICLTVDSPDEEEEEDDKAGEEEEEGSHTDRESTPAECHCSGVCECAKDLNTADHLMTKRVPNLRRTNQRNRRARDQRASWMTLSSTTSSMFGPLLNGNHLPPRQAIRQKGALVNVDRFVERFYNNHSVKAGASGGDGLQATAESSIQPEVHADGLVVAPGQVQEVYVAEPVSIHPLAADMHTVGPLTPDIASSVPFSNQAMEDSRGLIQSQPLTLTATKPAMSPGRSNSHPNLLTSFSDKDALQGESIGVAPWHRHHHHHHRQGHNSHTLDNCRHDNIHRSSQTPSSQTSHRPSHQQRHQYSFDHTSTRRGSLEPPSEITRSQPTYSTCSHPARPRLPPAPQQKSRLQIQVGGHPSRLLKPRQDPVSIVLQYSSELIAQQLCLIEREMLSQVQWYELVDAGWTKKKTPSYKQASSAASSHKEPSKGSQSSRASSIQISEASLVTAAAAGVGGRSGVLESGVEGGKGRNDRNSLHRSEGTVTPTPRAGGGGAAGLVKGEQRLKTVEDSHGIKRLVDRFNITCQWVTSEIVRTKDLQQRVKVVEKFIRIAHTCYNHSNFSSLIQLMLGLQSHSVSRLNQTWARVRAQEMRIMEDLVEYTSPFHNWKHLRDDMKSIADEWGGSGNGGAGVSASATAPTATEKSPPTSGGTTTSSFFGKRRISKDSTMAAAAAVALQYKGTASSSGVGSKVSSSGVGSKVSSSTTRAKEKELKMSQQNRDAAARASQPKGCIPFLVNIHKHRTTATIIKRILTFKTLAGRYPFEQDPDVRQVLMGIRGLDPNEISRLSSAYES
ncbi:hypothetical protein BG015_003888 [Linnemannia schmuckeri]|uniref:Uncharacterized protein n=1 Tax=Linnemannia schmuckeri TaxID=64567 RepID=A0A9P5VFK2_9FUNG|nr:hypothetical protein BG015_003888 [Linnemannia schmuckeri]